MFLFEHLLTLHCVSLLSILRNSSAMRKTSYTLSILPCVVLYYLLACTVFVCLCVCVCVCVYVCEVPCVCLCCLGNMMVYHVQLSIRSWSEAGRNVHLELGSICFKRSPPCIHLGTFSWKWSCCPSGKRAINRR